MSASKHFEKIAWAVTAVILVVTILFMNGGALGLEVMAHTMGYENRLFDNTRVHTIDIVMNNWDEFIGNATSEEYYTAAVVIDGEAYKNVAIRGKGNTSLSSVSSMNSDRYSFKIEFDHYDNSLTYHGLDKLSLNNLIQDSTMMKDYLTYTMMHEFGAATPLCSFVYITVNGEDWGLYLAVEGVEDSFLERNYGFDYGELYKPDSMSFGGGRGNGKDFSMDDFMNREESSGTSDSSGASKGGVTMPDMGSFDFSQIPGMNGGGSTSEGGNESSFGGGFNFGGMGGFGMGSSDVKLQYIDDNTSSYSNIWNNAKTDITASDQTRLIESLRKLSNGEEIESVVNIDAVIRYFVVHNYVCNGDSYTGSMIHNYYLYEENGQMAMIPWDYNLAFGTFSGGNGQSTVNTPIDAPVSGGAGEDRPMWKWILSDDSYTELYHRYFAEFLDTVDVQAIIDNACNLIKSYVKKDPSKFYTYEEFETGVATMRQFCSLRSESISQQLANGKTTTNMSYVDASGLTVSAMGSMGGMGGGFGGGMPDRDSNNGSFGNRGSSDTNASGKSGPDANDSDGTNVGEAAAPTTEEIPQNGGMPNMGNFDPSQMPNSGEIPDGFDPSQMTGGFGGQMPEGFDPSGMQGGFGGMFPGQSSGGKGAAPSENSDSTETSDRTKPSGNGNRPSGGNMQMPGGNWGSGMNGVGDSAQGNTGLLWLAVSVLILGAGLILAKLYKC